MLNNVSCYYYYYYFSQSGLLALPIVASFFPTLTLAHCVPSKNECPHSPFLSWFLLSLFEVHFLTTDFFFDLPVITSISLNNMLMLLFHGLTNLNSVDLFPSKGNLAYPHHSPSLPISSQYRYGTSRSSSIYKFN